MLFAPCCHQCGEYRELIKSIHLFYLLHLFQREDVDCVSLDIINVCVTFAHERTYLNIFFLPGEFIIGRVIKAMNNSWHPDCFCCDICQAVLADVGFVKNAGRSVIYIKSPQFRLRFFLNDVF